MEHGLFLRIKSLSAPKSSGGGQQEKKLLCGKMSRNFTGVFVLSPVNHLSLAQKASTVYSEGKMSSLLIDLAKTSTFDQAFKVCLHIRVS